MRKFGSILIAMAMLGGCDSTSGEPATETSNSPTTATSAAVKPDPQPSQTATAIQPTISLGQALRCKRIAEFAIQQSGTLGGLTQSQARTIALKAQNAAYAEGAKQELTPKQIDDQERDIYLGYEGAGMSSLPMFGDASDEQVADADSKHRAAVERVIPELRTELTEICGPLFL